MSDIIETYRPRGLGVNFLPCYICGEGGGKAQPDMAAFVDDKEAGERVVAMFQLLYLKAKLDYRPSEPNWVQVKVGACEEHKPNLEKLYKLTREAKKINMDIIKQTLELDE